MFDFFKNNQRIILETQELKPISVQERLPIIDVLRGAAILGILFLNMQPFSFPDHFGSMYLKVFSGLADKIIFTFVEFFGRGKFYSMLSFLFGLGMAIQVNRANNTEKKFSLFYSRRLLILLGLGLFHDMFLWGGIILLIYSVMGFFLLFFKQRQPNTLLTWAVIILLIPILVNVVFPRPQNTSPANINQNQAAEIKMKKMNDIIHIHQDGSYREMFLLRIEKLKQTALIILRAGWGILGLFLLGVWAWQKKIFQDLENKLKFLKKFRWFSLGLGLTGTLVFFLLPKLFKTGQPLLVKITADFFHTVGTTALSFFYITAIILLMRKEAWKKLLKPLEAVGRMALSNYFLQTLICTTIFYSYGFRMFGKLGPAVTFLMVFPISAIQILSSNWWLKRFRFGPVEWLWRSLTYGKHQKMV